MFHGLARVQPGDLVWGDVRYGVVVLLVNMDDPVEAVVEWSREQVMNVVVNCRCTLGCGDIAIGRGVGERRVRFSRCRYTFRRKALV